VWKIIAPGRLLALVLLLGMLYVFFMPSKARSNLPEGASVIGEQYIGGFTQDYARFLKARISPEDYLIYTQKLSLVSLNGGECVDVNTYSWSGMSEVGEWWDPSDSFDHAYCEVGSDRDNYVVAKHERGYVFFKAISK
jgi:hypothetical protein